jgi:hypothetical protein
VSWGRGRGTHHGRRCGGGRRLAARSSLRGVRLCEDRRRMMGCAKFGRSGSIRTRDLAADGGHDLRDLAADRSSAAVSCRRPRAVAGRGHGGPATRSTRTRPVADSRQPRRCCGRGGHREGERRNRAGARRLRAGGWGVMSGSRVTRCVTHLPAVLYLSRLDQKGRCHYP